MYRSTIFRRLELLAILTFGLVSLIVPITLASNSSGLDPTFSDDGVVTTTIGLNSESNALVIQGNGKIIGVGYSDFLESPIFTMVRYNTDGSLDSSFGAGGIVTDSTGGDGYDVTLQPDGKIVTTDSKRMARYLSNGSLDNTLGNGGIITFTYNSPGHIAIQTGGKIIASRLDSLWYPQLTRYHTNGSLDTTFGTGGVVTIPVAGEGSYALAIQPDDNKIVAAGTSYYNGSAQFSVTRFDAEGGLDNTFGNGNVVTTTIGDYATCFDVAIQPDRKIVVSGYTFDSISSISSFATARYLANGSLDHTFGQGGVVTTTIADSATGYAVVIQADGKIVVSGYAEDFSMGNSSFAIARYNTNGSLDNTFGSGGIVTTTVGTTSESYDVAIDPNKNIVTIGRSGSFRNSTFAVARYSSTNSLYLPIIIKGY
jgi:uncharacterized delta-60 repeat protein